VFLQSFTLTFLAEWGDRSQIATIVLAAREVGINMKNIYMSNRRYRKNKGNMDQLFSNCVLGKNIGSSPNVKKAFFFSISWGKIPNSVVIK
jgi:hypothetical protein